MMLRHSRIRSPDEPMTNVPRISRPANDALEAAGLRTLEDAARAGGEEVAALHGMGPKGIRILADAIDAAGLGPWTNPDRP
jgi:hypothetical protein